MPIPTEYTTPPAGPDPLLPGGLPALLTPDGALVLDSRLGPLDLLRAAAWAQDALHKPK